MNQRKAKRRAPAAFGLPSRAVAGGTGAFVAAADIGILNQLKHAGAGLRRVRSVATAHKCGMTKTDLSARERMSALTVAAYVVAWSTASPSQPALALSISTLRTKGKPPRLGWDGMGWALGCHSDPIDLTSLGQRWPWLQRSLGWDGQSFGRSRCADEKSKPRWPCAAAAAKDEVRQRAGREQSKPAGRQASLGGAGRGRAGRRSQLRECVLGVTTER